MVYIYLNVRESNHISAMNFREIFSGYHKHVHFKRGNGFVSFTY